MKMDRNIVKQKNVIYKIGITDIQHMDIAWRDIPNRTESAIAAE